MREVTDGLSYKRDALNWQDRLRDEAGQLNERLTKLRGFMAQKGGFYAGLDVADQELLQEQEGLMTRLLAVLGKRLGRASGGNRPPESGGAPGST
jgi:hypothetical protein